MPNIKSIPLKTKELQRYAIGMPWICHRYANSIQVEDLTQLPSVLQKGDFLCKIDLQDTYLTIPVTKKARVYLHFLWKLLTVHLPALQTSFLTKNVYQMPKATAGLSSGSYPNNGSYKGAIAGTGPANCSDYYWRS